MTLPRKTDLRDALADPAPEPARRPEKSSGGLEARFHEGIDRYARRDFAGAERSFQEILKADPGHARARKALERTRRELTAR